MIERHYKAAEIAELLSISERGAYYLMECRKLAFVQIGKSKRVPESDLDRYLTENTQRPTTLEGILSRRGAA